MAGTATALNTTAAAPAPRATSSESDIWRRYLDILTLRGQLWAENLKFKSNEEALKKPPLPCSAEECETILKTLPEKYLPFALAQAGFCGDMEIGNRILEIHGPIHTELSVRGSQTFLNGEPLHYAWAWEYLRNASSPADIAKVMEWLPEVGMGWMVGKGSEHSMLFQGEALQHALKFVRKTQFAGELPHLVSGLVENPELLLALHERKGQTSFEGAFDRILCWVPEGTQNQFPDDLVPYKVEHSIHFNDTLKHSREDQSAVMPITAVTQEYLDTTVNRWASSYDFALRGAGLGLSDLRLCTSPTSKGIDIDGEMLLAHQASESIKHGFWERPGMVLCQTTVRFLSNFDIGMQEEVNRKASQDFVSNYAPIDLIAREYGRKDEENALIYVSTVGFKYSDNQPIKSFNDLVRLLDSHEPLKSHVKGVLSKDLMVYLTSLRGDKGVNVTSLPVLYREYGIDNQGISLQVWAMHVEQLHAEGFKFSADTDTMYCIDVKDGTRLLKPSQVAFLNIGMMDMDDQELQETHQKALQMGLWASPVAKPKTTSEALSALGRRKYNTNTVKGKLPYETNVPVLALRAYLHEAGIEACVASAKTVKHWYELRTVFGTEELKPYLNDAPLEARGKLFTQDLGV